MKTIILSILVLLFAGASSLHGQAEDAGAFDGAAADVQIRLEQAIAELNALRQEIAEQKLPLSRELSRLEGELGDARRAYQEASRALDVSTLELTNLGSQIKAREEEGLYVSNLLSEYIRNFESRLHIAELHRYEQALRDARLAPENSNLSRQQVNEIQAAMLSLSLDRLNDAIGGTRFEGTAVDADGFVKSGTFVLVGPAALFRSTDGAQVGTAEQRIGSLEPAVLSFADPKVAEDAGKVITTTAGAFPLDPTLGNAHRIAATDETFVEHIKKGGPVMYPIFAMAGIALLVALYKWLALSLIRKPSGRRVRELLGAVAGHDERAAQQKAAAISGPAGRMLRAGVEHIQEPRELIEEVMYEQVLTTRLKLERMLPFIAICASAAPLLGLLGTVTGIINTFKLITVFGSGDVKMLSGGISEALITTKFGLIVAIPSLLIYAFLSRKVRGVIGQMEASAVAFINQVSKSPWGSDHYLRSDNNGMLPATGAPTRAATTDQVKEILSDLLMPAARQHRKIEHEHEHEHEDERETVMSHSS